MQSEESTTKCLTKPSAGVHNDGCDNVNFELILHVDSELLNPKTRTRYVVKGLLGKGVYGQVAKCLVSEKEEFVALKIIKNQEAYTQQAHVEVGILNHLNTKLSWDEKRHIVRMNEWFDFKGHVCISFELLGPSLYERMKYHKRLSLDDIRTISKQILQGLVAIKRAGIIHCDLKPENILLSKREDSGSLEIKIIDFGLACLEDKIVQSYVQSRFYRSPEVAVGLNYMSAIDIWSFGCIVAELFLGIPLFPASSNLDLVKKIHDMLCNQSPDDLARSACDLTKKMVDILGNHPQDGNFQRPAVFKNNHSKAKLEKIIIDRPYGENLTSENFRNELAARSAFTDFLRRLLEINPEKRWSPSQALDHRFITEIPFGLFYKSFQGTSNSVLSSSTQHPFNNQNDMSQFGSNTGRNVALIRQQTLFGRQCYNPSSSAQFEDNYIFTRHGPGQHGQAYQNDFHHQQLTIDSYNYGATQQTYAGSTFKHYNCDQFKIYSLDADIISTPFGNIQSKMNIDNSTSNFTGLGCSSYRDQSCFKSTNSSFLTVGAFAINTMEVSRERNKREKKKKKLYFCQK